MVGAETERTSLGFLGEDDAHGGDDAQHHDVDAHGPGPLGLVKQGLRNGGGEGSAEDRAQCVADGDTGVAHLRGEHLGVHG